MKRNVYGRVFFIYSHDDASDYSVPDCTRSLEWENAYFKKLNTNTAEVKLIY